LAGACRG